MLLFLEMQVTKKIFTRMAATIFFINLVEFPKQSLHLKINSNSIFLCVFLFETKNIYSNTHSTYAGG